MKKVYAKIEDFMTAAQKYAGEIFFYSQFLPSEDKKQKVIGAVCTLVFENEKIIHKFQNAEFFKENVEEPEKEALRLQDETIKKIRSISPNCELYEGTIE